MRSSSGSREHALGAVIANAIEVSPRGGAVTVRVGTDNGSWSIDVSDEGPGIADEHLTEVFRPYFTTKADGSGIGLAVARRVVLSHGGEIGIDSRTAPADGAAPGDGSGTTVRVVLPLIASAHHGEGL